ncbi:MAG: hypothetical protein AAGI24_04145 [Pseudomonadota bacterium]
MTPGEYSAEGNTLAIALPDGGVRYAAHVFDLPGGGIAWADHGWTAADTGHPHHMLAGRVSSVGTEWLLEAEDGEVALWAADPADAPDGDRAAALQELNRELGLRIKT